MTNETSLLPNITEELPNQEDFNITPNDSSFIPNLISNSKNSSNNASSMPNEIHQQLPNKDSKAISLLPNPISESPNDSSLLPNPMSEAPNQMSELPNDSSLLPNPISESPNDRAPNDSSLLPNPIRESPNDSSLLPNRVSELPNDSSLLPNPISESPNDIAPNDSSLLPNPISESPNDSLLLPTNTPCTEENPFFCKLKNYHEWKNLKEYDLSSYCKAGNKFYEINCASCGAMFVPKKPVDKKMFKPSSRTPMYACRNENQDCKHAVCFHCYKLLMEEA